MRRNWKSRLSAETCAGLAAIEQRADLVVNGVAGIVPVERLDRLGFRQHYLAFHVVEQVLDGYQAVVDGFKQPGKVLISVIGDRG